MLLEIPAFNIFWLLLSQALHLQCSTYFSIPLWFIILTHLWGTFDGGSFISATFRCVICFIICFKVCIKNGCIYPDACFLLNFCFTEMLLYQFILLWSLLNIQLNRVSISSSDIKVFLPKCYLEQIVWYAGEAQSTMEWASRMKIAIGSAKGLAYLHEDCECASFLSWLPMFVLNLRVRPLVDWRWCPKG